MMENGEYLDAIRALRNRGVDQAEPLLEHATPEQILAACGRYDHRQGRVGPGWLVTEIRAGHYTDPEPEEQPSVSDRLRAQFAEHQARLPVGTAISHCRDLECIGMVRVEESSYPVLILQCTVCRTVDGVSVHELHRLHRYQPPTDPDMPF